MSSEERARVSLSIARLLRGVSDHSDAGLSRRRASRRARARARRRCAPAHWRAIRARRPAPAAARDRSARETTCAGGKRLSRGESVRDTAHRAGLRRAPFFVPKRRFVKRPSRRALVSLSSLSTPRCDGRRLGVLEVGVALEEAPHELARKTAAVLAVATWQALPLLVPQPPLRGIYLFDAHSPLAYVGLGMWYF